MSALATPNAPSSIARRTTARMVSSSAGVAGPSAWPLAYARTVAAPRNEPKLTDAPCRAIASSQFANPRAPANERNRRASALSVTRYIAITWAFAGAGVAPSPRIIVVTPCVTMLTTRLSPRTSADPDCAWISMNPGATTRPRASIRRLALARASHPAGVMRAIRSPVMATSP